MTIRIGIVVAVLLILSGCTDQTVDEARMECLSEASNAPTDMGVRQRVMLCHQKYPKQHTDWSKFTPITRIEQLEKPGLFRQLGDNMIRSVQTKLEGVASMFGNDNSVAHNLRGLSEALSEYESVYRKVERGLEDKANRTAQAQTSQAKAPVDWSQFTPTGQVFNEDVQYGFSISRPSEWFPQERPSPDVRFMFGLEGDGYIGNCNIAVLLSPSTANSSQEAVDRNENQRQLSASFFEASLRNAGTDAKVSNVRQTRRGPYFGHLVDYSYFYFSPKLNAPLHIRAELFSHSRPGKVYSFTCLTGATSSDAAQSGFEKELKSFENLSASLRVDS